MEYKSRKEILERIKTLKAEQQRLEEESIKLLKEEGGEAVYTIRPAGRHVLTIGEGLIQDRCAALIELVKNSYDADANSVDIIFSKLGNDNVRIMVKDDGHGMSVDDLVRKWLVPSTENKVVNRKSPKGRIMQGRKGIGRYAASILGDDLKLETITSDGTCNSIEINWSEFNAAEYLDQVDVNVKSHHTAAVSGTTITILGDKEQLSYWNEEKIGDLGKELKKIITPKEIDENIGFKINLGFDGFYNDPLLDITEPIEPFPILDLFDYRIYGKVDSFGNGTLFYECQKIVPTVKESIDFSYGKETNCGELEFDIRVYDRDVESINEIIKRGLKSKTSGKDITRNEAKNLINSINGIGVYRNGFRIRPLGNPDFDWLKLNQGRIQNPSRKIGGDQVTGYVLIQSEELSHLEEKSARDGLKENESYEELKEITKQVIAKLEERRYILRSNLGLSRSGKKLENQLNSLYDYSKLKKKVKNTLKEAGISEETLFAVDSLIEEEGKKKNKTVEEIQKTVALYQGQATAGKIVYVVLHEGRRPLNYIKGQIKNLMFYEEKYNKTKDVSASEKIVEFSSGIEKNSQIFVKLFSRLDPLASKRRQPKKDFNVKDLLTNVFAVFENELQMNKVEVIINCDEKAEFFGWEQDFYAIFTNLIDNSIFWMEDAKTNDRKITVDVLSSSEEFCIRFRDTGPGISKNLLDSGVIFEPDFSTKPDGGSGLGLAIAGEAAERNGLNLSAEESECGALFILSKKEE